jgi:hypothetical protein
MKKLTSEAFISQKQTTGLYVAVVTSKSKPNSSLIFLIKRRSEQQKLASDSAERTAILSSVVDWALCWKIAKLNALTPR